MTMYFRKLCMTVGLVLLGFGLTAQNTWAWPGLGGTGGDFDENLQCTYSFTNTLTPLGGDQYTYSSSGEGPCTWTDPQKGKRDPIVESASCTTQIDMPVTQTCVVDPNDPTRSIAIYTGQCQADLFPVRVGSVNCSGGGTGSLEGQDPAFCANSDGCTNVRGYGIQEKGKGKPVIGMTADQCAAFDAAYGGQSFLYKEYYDAPNCGAGTGKVVQIDEATLQAGHNHSWNLSDEPYVDQDKQGNIVVSTNNAFAVEQGEIGPVDSEIDPNTFDLSTQTGTFTVRIAATPSDPGTVAINVTLIDSVEVNGVPAVPGSCSVDASNPANTRLSCSVPRFVDGVFTGIIQGNQAAFTTRGTLSTGATFVSDTELRDISQ